MEALERETDLAKCTEHENLLLCILDSDNIHLQVMVLPPLLAAFLDKNGGNSLRIPVPLGEYHIWLAEGNYDFRAKELERIIDIEHAIICFYDAGQRIWQPTLSDFGDFESVIDRNFGKHWRNIDCWLFAAEWILNDSQLETNRREINYLGNCRIYK